MPKAIIAGQGVHDRRLKFTHAKEVTEGDIVVVNGHVVVAAHQANAGVQAQYVFRGPVLFPKSTDTTIDVGDVCYFDKSSGFVNKVAARNTRVGICMEAATKESSKVFINLCENM